MSKYVSAMALMLGIAPMAGAIAAPGAPAPHMVTIVHQADVNKPAAAVWASVGHYCDLSKWLGKSCDIVSGHDGEVGAVREIDHSITEVLVGKTATSYTYAQPESVSAPIHFYHGTLDVEPVTPQTSRIVYTLIYDNAGITDPAARKKEYDGRSAVFAKAVDTMKSLAEAAQKP